MTPQPTDKLDATAYVAVNGPADDALFNDERIVRPHATGPTAACLSRVLGNGHALVLRGARHSNVPGLPVQTGRAGPRSHAGLLPAAHCAESHQQRPTLCAAYCAWATVNCSPADDESCSISPWQENDDICR